MDGGSLTLVYIIFFLVCSTCAAGRGAERLHASGARQVSTGIRMTRKKVREATQGRYGGWVGGRRVDPY
jgi:hypothetical protein